MAHPIWKDYIISVVAEVVEFSVYYDNNEIYTGKAYRKPNAQSIEIKINDICADFLHRSFPENFPNNGELITPYFFNFDVATRTNDGIEATTEIQFVYDWSFDYLSNTNTERLITAPILRKIPQGAPFIISSTAEFMINGLPYQIELPNMLSAFTRAEGESISVDTREESLVYEVVGGCHRYMLYYLNAYGGWDFLLVEGKERQTDNYTRHTIEQTYNNDQSRNRGTRNYRNDIARKWVLHTLWIDDAGARNMHHLLGSTDVYLYDMQDEQLYPITIANTSCEYKSYRNNGNQLTRYDIEATLAQNLIRR